MTPIRTFGKQPTSAPAMTFREIHFPHLMSLDTNTTEGRISRWFSSASGTPRDLPATISMQYVDNEGHQGSVPVGALHEITIDPESKVMSGKGWLADTPDGHLAEVVVVSEALSHNSADLADVPADGIELVEHGDYFDDNFRLELRFNNYALSKTTLVASPAFAPAKGQIPDTIAASLGLDEPLVVTVETRASAHTDIEIMASMSTRPSFAYFNRPEADIPHPIVVDEPDENGWIPVYGHLAQWRKLHRDARGVLRHPPRGYDNYANFMKPKAVLTDGGWAPAGPITLLGGHVTLQQAIENVENMWANVRVVDGQHGPWVCGVMAPHCAGDDIVVWRARAAKISGLWQSNCLRLISSVLAAGYEITADEDEDMLAAGFYPDDERQVPLAIPSELFSLDELNDSAQQRILEWARARSAGAVGGEAPRTAATKTFASFNFPTEGEWSVAATTDAQDSQPTFDPELARLARLRELELEDEPT